MNFIRRLNRENVFFQARVFKFGDLLENSCIKIRNSFKMSAEYLQNYACYAKTVMDDIGCECQDKGQLIIITKFSS